MQLNRQFFTGTPVKKIIAGVLILGLIAAIIILNLSRNSQPAAVPVKTTKAEIKPMQNNVFASGHIRLTTKQEFYAFTGTTVKELNVAPGDRVIKGQVLGLLDAADIEDNYNAAKNAFIIQEANYYKALHPREEELSQLRSACRKAEAEYINAQKSFQRTKALYDQAAISASEFERAELDLIAKETAYKTAADNLKIKESGPTGYELEALKGQLEQARSVLDQMQSKLDKTILRAEMDGVVTALEVALGDYVQPGTRLITIGDTSQLEVTAGVSEADSVSLRPGQKVRVTTAAQPGREYTGVLASVSPGAVTAKSGSGSQIEVPVIVKITGSTEGLRPGYTVDIIITTVDKPDALLVPYEAVIEKDGRKKIFVVENNIASLREVSIGIENALSTEILSGVDSGETVVVSPPENLQDGDRVKEMPNLPAEAEVIIN